MSRTGRVLRPRTNGTDGAPNNKERHLSRQAVRRGRGLLDLRVRLHVRRAQLINRITPVCVGEEAERGLDEAMHGENAYTGAIA
ncbi:MAG: hypothetical protein QOD48_1628 [Gaiellaceae bacterium]|nr:hypothetical protein [Gaiellaceae bacterium]